MPCAGAHVPAKATRCFARLIPTEEVTQVTCGNGSVVGMHAPDICAVDVGS